MLYADWVRGFAIPLALVVFGCIGLARAVALGGGWQLAPVLLLLCLFALAGLRLRYFFRARAARRSGSGRQGEP